MAGVSYSGMSQSLDEVSKLHQDSIPLLLVCWTTAWWASWASFPFKLVYQVRYGNVSAIFLYCSQCSATFHWIIHQLAFCKFRQLFQYALWKERFQLFLHVVGCVRFVFQNFSTLNMTEVAASFHLPLQVVTVWQHKYASLFLIIEQIICHENFLYIGSSHLKSQWIVGLHWELF